MIAPPQLDGLSPAWPAMLACIGYALLVLAWSMANPPFAAPDEWAHQLRAIGMSNGSFLGERGAWPIPPDASELRAVQTRWANQALRSVTVPAGASPAGLDCNAMQPLQSAACVDRARVPRRERVQLTPVGTYQPLPYLLPALAIRLATDPRPANRLARIASALPCVALLVCAVVLATDRGRANGALLGLLVATTPMVVFLLATLNGSGLETAAGMAFAFGLARLGRSTGDDATWALTGVAGAVLAQSRSTGVLWVVLLGGTFAACGLRPFWLGLRAHRRVAVAALLAIGTASVGNRLWESAYGPVAHVGFGAWPGSTDDVLHLLREVGRQEIGLFGTIDSPLPQVAYPIWLTMLGVLVAVALRCGTGRERVVLLGMLLGIGLAGPVLLHAAVLFHTGFMIQGRHVLPVVTGIPILAAEILVRGELRAARPRPGWLLGSAASLAAIVQLAGFCWNARRHAVGIAGPWLFPWHAEWAPPLGWWPWLAVVLVGCLAIAASGAVACRCARAARW